MVETIIINAIISGESLKAHKRKLKIFNDKESFT
jgi:hypothetical protein